MNNMKHLEDLKSSKNFEEVIENVKKIKKDWKLISEEEREQIIRFDSCLNFDVDDKLSGHLDGVIPEKDNIYGAVEMYEDGIKKVMNKVTFTESLSIVVPTGVRYFDEKFKSVENKKNTSTEATSTKESVKTTEGNATPTSTEEVVTSTEGNATTTSQK